MTMRLATWNLWCRFGPWEARQAAIARTLDELDADVVCLQETWVVDGPDGPGGVERQAERLGSDLGRHAAVADPVVRFDGVGVANAVLSRWPVERSETVPLPGADGRPSPRHAVVVRLAAPFGPVSVVSAHLHHLPSGSATRVAQATALAELVARLLPDPARDLPVLVGADMNAAPHADELRLLTGATSGPVAGRVLTDCWEHAGDGGAGHTWSGTNPYLADAALPNRRLDYLFVSWPRPRPVGNPRRCWLGGTEPVDGVQPSDHYAVVADLVTPPVRS